MRLGTHREVNFQNEPGEGQVDGEHVQRLHQPLLHHVMHVMRHIWPVGPPSKLYTITTNAICPIRG